MSSYVNGYFDGFDEGNSIKNRESSSCFLDGQSPVGGKGLADRQRIEGERHQRAIFFYLVVIKIYT